MIGRACTLGVSKTVRVQGSANRFAIANGPERGSRRSEHKLRSVEPHFLQPDLNEAARAADASREVKEQWLPGV